MKEGKMFISLAFTIFVFFYYGYVQGDITNSKYNRSEWNHWIDSDHNCLNTRQEILKSRSLEKVSLNKKGCRVTSGKWNDYYFNKMLSEATSIDIDHLIPLKHANDSGGWKWSAKEKETFANDPENLVITNRKYNREKGAQTIATWLPVDKTYACKYVDHWVKVKKKYKLEIFKDEQATIEGLKPFCEALEKKM